MGEAKRRKAILGDRYGKPFAFEKSKDYVAFGEKYIPLHIIDSAAHFSWEVQHDATPTWLESTGWNVRKLNELLWNPVTKQWLVEAMESSFFRNLLPGYDGRQILTVLAKALAILAMYREDVLYLDDEDEF